MNRAEIETRYVEMFGFMPGHVRQRLDVAQAAGRLDALPALEALRAAFLDGDALPRTTQRLVHFGMTLGQADPAVIAIHARSALKEGATLRELYGVCETAAVVCGMPAFTRGTTALHDLLRTAGGDGSERGSDTAESGANRGASMESAAL